MECMQAKALRASLRGEWTQHDVVDEVCLNTTTNSGVSFVHPGDDLSDVDEFLNLQNDEFEDWTFRDNHEEQEQDEEEEKYSLSLDDDNSIFSNAFSESQLASELAVPDDDLAELEWVSRLMDDSLSEFSPLHTITKQRTEPRPANRVEPEPNLGGARQAPCFPLVPVKPRTKRARPATRPSSLSQLSESSSSSSSSSCASSPSPFGFSTTSFVFANPVQFVKPVGEPERKKQKRKPPVQAGSVATGPQFQRRCSHCQVQKTPQWRTGPLGAKTLCNACGVRFKSGRLFPEYRPACSPTFCSEVHSNSHRKVVEMRKKKDVQSGSGLTHEISSF